MRQSSGTKQSQTQFKSVVVSTSEFHSRQRSKGQQNHGMTFSRQGILQCGRKEHDLANTGKRGGFCLVDLRQNSKRSQFATHGGKFDLAQELCCQGGKSVRTFIS